MKIPKAVSDLIEAFERLPSIGPKSAARLTYYLLHVPDFEISRLSNAVANLKKNTVVCSTCFNISEKDPCEICDDSQRDHSIICVVEQPLDILAFERTMKFKGVYHVLNGAISPLNNIGPDEIRIQELINRLKNESGVTEVILATNPNMEGEATAMYLEKEISKLKTQSSKLQNIKLTRLAYGLPTGADIEYADEMTLTRALEGRREF